LGKFDRYVHTTETNSAMASRIKRPVIRVANAIANVVCPEIQVPHQGTSNQGSVNRGTGAGGAQTNANGKAFEEKTCHLPYLGATKHAIPDKKGKNDVYYEKKTEKGSITYLSQGGLKSYFKWKFDVEMDRHPDEAYVIQEGENYTLRILEKKNQNVEGSVEDKLMTGYTIAQQYLWRLKKAGKQEWSVQYAYCLSAFLAKKYGSNESKWEFLREFNQAHGVEVFFGEEEDYHEKLAAWIKN
jgi:hypothetical protein